MNKSDPLVKEMDLTWHPQHAKVFKKEDRLWSDIAWEYELGKALSFYHAKV